VRTAAQIKIETGWGTVFATITDKVWKCEGEGIPEQALSIYERTLQSSVERDMPCGPLPSGAIDNDLARAAAQRYGSNLISLDERPDISPQYHEDGTPCVY